MCQNILSFQNIDFPLHSQCFMYIFGWILHQLCVDAYHVCISYMLSGTRPHVQRHMCILQGHG